MLRTFAPALLLLLLLLPTSNSQASPRQLPAGFSPWLLPEGTKVLRLQLSALGAKSQFSESGHLSTLPLNEAITSHDYGVEMRWGLTPDLEVAAEGFYRYLARSGDIYPSFREGCAEPFIVGATCYDPNTAILGPGDLWLSLRYNLMDLPTSLTIAPILKLPLFYEGIPDSDTLSDGLRLGDGQVDVGAWLLTGRGLGDWPALIRMGVGFLHRFGAPGTQLLLEAKGGYVFKPWLIATLGMTGRISVTPGEATLLVVPDPGKGTLSGVEGNANSDWGVLEGGVLLRNTSGQELTISAERTVWGKNTFAYQGFNLTGTFFF